MKFSPSSDFQAAALDAMREATRAVLEVYASENPGIEYKDEKEPVTRADIQANQVLEKRLSDLRPDAGWLSEESERDLQALARKELIWVVDPIDGTREFIDKNGEFSISVGLVQNGEPVWGAVSLPAEPRIMMSGRDGVAVYDLDSELQPERKLLDKSAVDLRKSRICVSRTEWNKGLYSDQAQELQIHPEGSVARKLALVSVADYDLTVSLYPKNDWDIAGGLALVQAAGGLIIRPDTGTGIDLSPPGARRPGLCCGRPDPVMQYHQFFQHRGMKLRDRYGSS
ncbi:MAG: 3'(2'),5'-bisphosphate nucleotidase CysQ [Leptospiraceae bacterium]|nr:3'(2'),5'-bisphosphate nucleotidase CysQ [Leptospiraceae bacterium]